MNFLTQALGSTSSNSHLNGMKNSTVDIIRFNVKPSYSTNNGFYEEIRDNELDTVLLATSIL